MRYGIIGDIHANWDALQAALALLDQERVDKFICVGDVVGYGAEPSRCIQEVIAREMTCVAGNHDFAVCGKMSDSYFNAYARDAVIWTRNSLTDKEMDFLRQLPLVATVDDITVVHGALNYPDMFDYVQTCYDAKVCFEVQESRLAVFGHSHVPVCFFDGPTTQYSLSYDLRLTGFPKTLLNVGSVGQPRDENPDACFVIYDTEAESVAIRRVAYDIDAAAQKIHKAGLPDVLAERLYYGR
ncbi:MAG: metallophosphoesterase family protein [Planctomycetes bacterium]|nr:metallophosphoesterase family protein [Planctomycetota bacterium]